MRTDTCTSGYIQVLAEYSSTSTAPERRYVWGHDLISQTLAINAPPSTFYYGLDGQGSIRILFDPTTGAVVTDYYDYDAYGSSLAQSPGGSSATPNHYRYTGQQWDEDLGMYFLRARYFNPQTGRFWSQDTKEGEQEEPKSLHLYLYCEGAPVNNIDPSGHEIEGMLGGMDISGMLDGLNSIAGKIKSIIVGGGSPGTGHTTVHIWSFRGKNQAWGHASMTLQDGTHISWWPSGVGRVGMKFLPNVYSAPANDPQTFADDIRLEGQSPDKNIVITSLNEAKIKTWWIAFKPTHLWKTLSQNCSTTVADGLKAGDASSSHSIWGFVRLQWASHDIVWTPAKVEAYANAVNQYH